MTFGAGVQPIPLSRYLPTFNDIILISGYGVEDVSFKFYSIINITLKLIILSWNKYYLLFIQNYRTTTNALKKAFVKLIPQSTCQAQYQLNFQSAARVTDAMFCAGYTEQDACYGDSGSPAVVNGKLVGIVSGHAGIMCADPNFPSRYTSIPYLYNWIVSIVYYN